MRFRWLLFVIVVTISGCDDWDEIRNKPEQQVHDKQVCVAGGMEYATNAYGEVKCIHTKEKS